MALRAELLDGESLYSLSEAKVLIESLRKHYDTFRPHSTLPPLTYCAVVRRPRRCVGRVN